MSISSDFLFVKLFRGLEEIKKNPKFREKIRKWVGGSTANSDLKKKFEKSKTVCAKKEMGHMKKK